MAGASAKPKDDRLIGPFVLVAMVDANIAKPGLAHEIGRFLRLKQMEVVFCHFIVLHLFLGAERDGGEAAVLEDSANLRKPLKSVGPEIDSIDGERPVEGGSGKRKASDIPALHSYAALCDFAAKAALGFVDHVQRNIDAGDDTAL
jgi:hypothetical protein